MDFKKLNKIDPINRFVDKDSDEDMSPMDPPDAYMPPATEEVEYDKMSDALKKFMDEHKECMTKLDVFEDTLNKIKTNEDSSWSEINDVLSDFFEFVDNNIRKHNIKEEKLLFPLLNQRYIEKGEHSTGPDKKNAIDMLEDDHTKFIQIAAITFTMFGLASKLPDKSSRLIVLDLALEQGMKMVEMLRLHIFREDKIVFPFAQLNLTEDELSEIKSEMDRFNLA